MCVVIILLGTVESRWYCDAFCSSSKLVADIVYHWPASLYYIHHKHSREGKNDAWALNYLKSDPIKFIGIV